MNDDAALFAAAREVRPFLPDLVERDALAVDGELAAALLSRDPDDARLNRIELVFGSNGALINWVGQFLAGGETPPEVVGILSRFPGAAATAVNPGLAGDPEPQPGTRFSCPNRDYARYVLRRGEHVGQCPTCGLDLVRAP
jgi:hypothetical protein